jgi:hypothetical protein
MWGVEIRSPASPSAVRPCRERPRRRRAADGAFTLMVEETLQGGSRRFTRSPRRQSPAACGAHKQIADCATLKELLEGFLSVGGSGSRQEC